MVYIRLVSHGFDLWTACAGKLSILIWSLKCLFSGGNTFLNISKIIKEPQLQRFCKKWKRLLYWPCSFAGMFIIAITEAGWVRDSCIFYYIHTYIHIIYIHYIYIYIYKYICMYIYIYNMVFTTEGLFEVAIESWPKWLWTHDHWIPFRFSNQLSYQALSSTRTQSQLCTATSVSLFVQCPISFHLLPSSCATFILI